MEVVVGLGMAEGSSCRGRGEEINQGLTTLSNTSATCQDYMKPAVVEIVGVFKGVFMIPVIA